MSTPLDAVPADTTVEVWRRQMAATAKRSIAGRLEEWSQLNLGIARMAYVVAGSTAQWFGRS